MVAGAVSRAGESAAMNLSDSLSSKVPDPPEPDALFETFVVYTSDRGLTLHPASSLQLPVPGSR